MNGAEEEGLSGGRLAESDVRGKWAAFIGQRGINRGLPAANEILLALAFFFNSQRLMANTHPQPQAISLIAWWGSNTLYHDVRAD